MNKHRRMLSGFQISRLREFFFVAIVVFLATFAYLSASAQNTLPIAQRQQVDEIARQVLRTTGSPSASIGIVANGKIAYVQAYGNARLQPPVAATPEMRYSIGSVSKQFTAAGILILAQQGKLSLDQPVSTWLPQLTRANEVTVHELLSHTAGYAEYYAEDYSMPMVAKSISVDGLLRDWGRRRLDFDSGTEWQYSNTNFVIAGKIIEIVSGMPYLDFLRQNIFQPLRMTGVLSTDGTALPEKDAQGTIRYALGPARPAPLDGAGWMAATGELAMPVRDLLLWDLSIIHQSLLQPKSYREIFTPARLKDGSDAGYNMGQWVSTRDGHLIVQHSGEISGFTSENLILPNDKFAVAVLTNLEASSAASLIANEVAALLAGLPQTETQQSTNQARQVLLDLQQGKLDPSQLTANCNAYFDPQARADFASSLKPLGPLLDFVQTGSSRRGGMAFHVYRAVFAHQHVNITTYQMPDGKIEQYLVIPAE